MQTKDVDVTGLIDPPSENDSSLPALPAMNVNVPANMDESQQKTEIISDQVLVGVYDEILDKIRSDTTEVDDYLSKFANMVFNDGDATTSSKEALVNLLKIKTDQSDKMKGIADLMTRMKTKDRLSPGGPWLAASQTNNISIRDGGQKRALLAVINKAKKDKKQLDN